MILETIAFWALAVLLVCSALAVVLSKNLFHAVLWLALALVSTAGIFLTLNAEFIAAVQVLLYAGGVITVVVFAIVVTERLIGEKLSQTNRRIGAGAVVSIGLAALLVRAIAQASPNLARPEIGLTLTGDLGATLIGRYVLAFELLAVLLLVGMIGASYFARPEE